MSEPYPENQPEPGHPSLPPDPFAQAQAEWVQHHHVYLGLRSGGYRWYEALFYLAAQFCIGTMMNSRDQQPPEPG